MVANEYPVIYDYYGSVRVNGLLINCKLCLTRFSCDFSYINKVKTAFFFQPFCGNDRNWIFRNLEFSEKFLEFSQKILEFSEKFLEFNRKILEFREK